VRKDNRSSATDVSWKTTGTAPYSTADAVIRFATTRTWKGEGPVVTLVTPPSQTGVKLPKDAMEMVGIHLQRLPGLSNGLSTRSPSHPPSQLSPFSRDPERKGRCPWTMDGAKVLRGTATRHHTGTAHAGWTLRVAGWGSE
jgi:hypothetical protein